MKTLVLSVCIFSFSIIMVFYYHDSITCDFQVRYFVADNVLDEVTFGWPRQKGDYQLKEHLALRLQRAINWVCNASVVYFLTFLGFLLSICSCYSFLYISNMSSLELN